jgi:hypothetical protein
MTILGFLLRVLCRQQTKPGTGGKLMIICAVAEIAVERQWRDIAILCAVQSVQA